MSGLSPQPFNQQRSFPDIRHLTPDILKQIPNLFTLLNLIFGCFACVFVLQNGIELRTIDDTQQFIVMNEEIWYASLFIALAAVTDFLDGFVARLFKAESEMGKQLDSLSDVVSFGVAPSLIMYQLLRMSFASAETGLETGYLLLAPAFLIAGAAAWRLARFNIMPSTASGFSGLPVPANGLFIACLPLISFQDSFGIGRAALNNSLVLFAIIIVMSLLMVSKLPLLSFKFKSFGFKENAARYLLIGVAVASAVFLGWIAAPVILLAYIGLSLAFKSSAS